jgi:leucyl/phenylalanyl-tRNA--protein transferase
MFAVEPDASKCAFVRLVHALHSQGCPLIDCQVHTDHLERFGAEDIPRAQFLQEIQEPLQNTEGINWKTLTLN